MQSNGKQFFTETEKVVSNEQLVNRTLQTGQAQANKIYQQGMLSSQKIDAITSTAKSVLSDARKGVQIQEQKNLTSYKTAFAKLQADYNNQVAEGGIIDNENISFEEKIKKKQEAFQKYKNDVNESLQTLKNKKNIFQTLLLTEENYNRELESLQLQTSEMLNDAERKRNIELKKVEADISLQNTQGLISSISNANNPRQVQQITKDINEAVNSLLSQGYITEAGKQGILQDLSKTVNNRSVEIDINNAKAKSLQGDTIGALNDLTNKYNALREGKVYNENFGAGVQSSRVENETKLLNAMFSLQKEFSKDYVSNVDYNLKKSPISNLEELDRQLLNEDLPEQTKDRLRAELLKQGSQFEKNPVSYILQKNPQATYKERQEFLNSNNLGYKTALKDEEASALKLSFNSLGLQTDRALNPIEDFKQILKSTSNLMGGSEPIKKEASIHLTGIQRLAVEKYLEEGEAEALPLINMLIEQNKNGGKLPSKVLLSEGMENAKSSEFFKTDLGKYEFQQPNFKTAEKLAKAYAEISNYKELSVDEAVKQFSNNKYSYVNTDKFSLKIDENKHDRDAILLGIRSIVANPNAIFGGNLDEVENIEVRENMQAQTDDQGNIIFYITSKKGSISNKGIARISIDEVEAYGFNQINKKTKIFNPLIRGSKKGTERLLNN